MNILYVSEYFYPRLAGGEIVSWQYCTSLASRGHKIHIITSRLQDTAKYEVLDGMEIYRPLQSASISGNNDIFGIGAVFKRASFAVKLYPVLKRFLRSHQIDIIYNVAYIPTLTASWIACSLGIPVITAVHSICGTTWFKLANPATALLNYFIEMFVIRFGRHDVIQCPSNYSADKVRLHTRSNIIVIPPPIDAQEILLAKETSEIKLIRQQLGISEKQLLLLFVGSLTPVKNACELITAMSNSRSDFKLILVGEGPERHRIETRISKLNMEHKVILLGQLSHLDTLRLINTCDILIMPSKIETFGIVVLEAIAMNKPVIATAVGCVPEILLENIYVIRHLNEINKLVETPILSTSDNNIVEAYSLSGITTRLERLLGSTIRGKINSDYNYVSKKDN